MEIREQEGQESLVASSARTYLEKILPSDLFFDPHNPYLILTKIRGSCKKVLSLIGFLSFIPGIF